MPDRDAPLFTIRMAARIVGIHQQTLRAYEREGLIRPADPARPRAGYVPFWA